MKFLILGICITFCCCGQKQKVDKLRCSEYNKKAVEHWTEFSRSNNQEDLIKSLSFFDQAISCDSLNSINDSMNSINIYGKINVLSLLGRYKETLPLLDKLYQRSGKNEPQLLVSKGLIFERLKMFDSSKVTYQQAFIGYKKQLAQNPRDSVRLICESIYLIAITEGKEASMNTLKTYLLRYPQDQNFKTYEEIIKHFDKSVLVGH